MRLEKTILVRASTAYEAMLHGDVPKFGTEYFGLTVTRIEARQHIGIYEVTITAEQNEQLERETKSLPVIGGLPAYENNS